MTAPDAAPAADPAAGPPTGLPPATRGRRPLIAAAAALIAVAAVAAGVWLAAGGGQDPEPAPTAPAASTEPSPAPSPTASPSPATPEEQAAADLDALVRGFRAVEDQAYADPSVEPSAAFDPYLRNPVSEQAVVKVLSFRRGGNTVAERSTEVHSVQVTALDPAAGTATAVECKTLSATGTDGAGQPRTTDVPRQRVEWTAKYIPAAGWRLYTTAPSEENTC